MGKKVVSAWSGNFHKRLVTRELTLVRPENVRIRVEILMLGSGHCNVQGAGTITLRFGGKTHIKTSKLFVTT